MTKLLCWKHCRNCKEYERRIERYVSCAYRFLIFVCFQMINNNELHVACVMSQHRRKNKQGQVTKCINKSSASFVCISFNSAPRLRTLYRIGKLISVLTECSIKKNNNSMAKELRGIFENSTLFLYSKLASSYYSAIPVQTIAWWINSD